MRKKEKIDFSNIPELTAADFKRMRHVTPEEVEEARLAIEQMTGKPRPRRVGRPWHGTGKAISIHLRIPPEVLKRVKDRAKKVGLGYQTYIIRSIAAAA